MTLKMRILAVSATFTMVAHLLGMIAIPQPSYSFRIVGIALLCLALSLHLWSLYVARSARLGIAFSNSTPNQIIRSGPFAIVRHPIYLSYLMAWSGGALCINALWPWVFVIMLLVQYVMAIQREEQWLLSSEMSAEYRQYQRTVGALFPLQIMARAQR